ncbi:hypothetical protein SANTM175S_07917 [Streptomyces antimycoticus]
MFSAVQPGVVDADGGAGGQLDGERAVPFAEGLAALGPGELGEAHDGVTGDHRHHEGGLQHGAELQVLAAVPAGDDPHLGGAQGMGAQGVEGVAVDLADLDGLGVLGGVDAADVAEGDRAVGDRAGEGDAAQLGAAVGESRRGLVAGEQPLVEVDGGQVAELRHGHVQQFPGSGLQIERGAYSGPGLVQQRQIAPYARGLLFCAAAAGDVRGQSGDADGTAGAAVQPVERDRPAAAVGAARSLAHERHIGQRLPGVQDLAQGGGQPVGLAARQQIVRGHPAVFLGGAAENLRKTLIDPEHPQVGPEEEETERRLTENGL